MEHQLKQDIISKWQVYFPEQEMPVAVFYAETLHGAEYVKKPAENPRGYTCMFAQALNRINPKAEPTGNYIIFKPIIFGKGLKED